MSCLNLKLLIILIIGENFNNIFNNELENINTDETLWPGDRTSFNN